MKTLLVILAMIGLLSFTYQGPDKTEIAGLLSNAQTRQEIFRSIQGNQKLMTEFMQEMHGNFKNMISVCATDSVMSRDLINAMSHYPGMMNMMNGYMYHHGMTGTYGHGMMMGSYNHSMMHSYGNNQ